MQNPKNYIEKLPKTELHLHIEGSLEPELAFKLAQRNNITLPYKSVSELKSAYEFDNLQSFLDIYYQGAQVLQKKQDFYDLTAAYLEKMAKENVAHVEIFFDPQTHTERGIEFATVIEGIKQALDDGLSKHGITSELIMCYLRHLSEEEAEETWKQAQPYLSWIKAVGLDSSERGHPPSKFERVFKKALDVGLKTVAHAGEEGPPDYIWQAIELLKVSRIDHGVRCLEDPKLVSYLAEKQIPLTVCPLSNVKLRVFDKLQDHNLKKLLDAGLKVTINSDDPSYFGGYLSENFVATQQALDLSADQIKTLVKNSIEASFATRERQQELLTTLDRVTGSHA